MTDGLFRLVEGDEVAQLLADGEEIEPPALLLGDVVAGRVGRIDPGRQEVGVVEHGVFQPRFREHAGELRLPDAFRYPGAGRCVIELLHQVAGHAAQLFPPVGVGDQGQDRLVEAAALEFEASGGHERPQAGEVLGLLLGEPQQERSGEMQRERHLGVPFHDVKEGQVGSFVVLRVDPGEVARRLVVVEAQERYTGAVSAGDPRVTSGHPVASRRRPPRHAYSSMACRKFL